MIPTIDPSRRRTYLPSINTLACSKAADVEPVLENMNLSYFAQSNSSVTRYMFIDVRCTILLNLSFLT